MQNLHAVTRVMAGGFFWMLLAYALSRDFFVPFFLCMAAHTGNIVTARLRVVRARYPLWRTLAVGWAVPSLLFGLLGAVGIFFGKYPVSAIALVPVAVALSVVLFAPTWPVAHLPGQKGRIWFSETIVAVLASLVGLCKF